MTAVAALALGAGCRDATATVTATASGTAASVAAPTAVPDGAVPLPGAWRPLAGLPASCDARVAVDAAASVAPLPWRACTSGRPGCQAFLADWGTPRDGFRFRPGVFEAAFEDAAGVHVSYLRSDGPGAPYSLHVVQRLHGVAEAAVYSPHGACAVAASGSRHGLVVRAVMAPGTAPAHYLAWSSWDAPTALIATAASYGAEAPLSQQAARGDGLITLEAMGLDGTVVDTAYRLADHGFVRPAAVDAPPLRRPLPVDGGYVGMVAADVSALVRVDADGARRGLVEPAAGMRLRSFALDRARADALVWAERPLADDGATVLWTAALPVGAARAAPRRVARVPDAGAIVANAGVVALVESPERARLVRLSDGRGWELPREPDAPWLYPLWVNDDAAWFVVSEVLPGEPGFPAQSGVVRIDRASLGAPTTPGGA